MTASRSYRILHLLNHSLPIQDGYAYRTAAILREQAVLGWAPAAVTSDRHTPGPAEETVGDLHFFRTSASAGWLARKPVVEQLATIQTLARRALEIANRVQPDVLHAHSPCLSGLAALKVGRRLGIPVVYEMRSSWEDAAVVEGQTMAGSPRFYLSRALETFVLRRADAVTTICESLRAEIGQRGIPASRVTVIPNAVDGAAFAGPPNGWAAIRDRHAPAGQKLVGFIGSFYSWEGLNLLIEAIGLIRQQGPDVRLLLVGGGVEEQRLKAQTAAAGLSESVVFAGRVPHGAVAAYYRAMDLLVYPRPKTPLTDMVTPLKPLEAMAAGRPIVASDVAGHRELITDGRTGLLFRAGDPRSLAATIEGALRDPDLPVLAERGRRWVNEERTWQASVARYRAVYESVLAAVPRVIVR